MFDIPNVTPRGFKQPVSETLPVAVARIVQALHPQKIILFGSYAYGNPTPDSDVDLLVVVEPNGSARERYRVASASLYPRPFPVDILVKSPEELECALTNRDFFVSEIVTQGQVMYERPQ